MGYLPNAPNTQEGAEDRVFAHNEWFRNAAGAQGAYSAFIVYNPPGAHLSFNDSGDTANAYLGGPWTNMLYRNGGYDVADNAAIFAHETGHIFWACDEYSYCSRFPDCGNCAEGSGPRPTLLNTNCEASNCDNHTNHDCVMKYHTYWGDDAYADEELCTFSRAQLGW